MTVAELIKVLEGSPDKEMEARIHKAAAYKSDASEIEYITILNTGEVWIEGIIL